MNRNDEPHGSHHLTLAPDGAGYFANYRQGDGRQAMVTLWLPRHVVDRAVFDARKLALDLTADGTVMVYAEGTGSQTLARATLETLITAALEVLDAEGDLQQLPLVQRQVVHMVDQLVRFHGAGLSTGQRSQSGRAGRRRRRFGRW